MAQTGLLDQARDWLAVALGGGLGALARWRLSDAVQRRGGPYFPWGTLAVNVVGSFLLGFIMGAAVRGGVFSRWQRLLLATGFAGAFTTFSTFMYESLVLLAREPLYGAASMVASLVLGMLGVYLGIVAAGVVYG